MTVCYLRKSLWFPRSHLRSKCNGFDKAIITQANTPIGSKLVYDGEKKRTLQVTPEIFNTFAKVCCLSFMAITTTSAACLVSWLFLKCCSSVVISLLVMCLLTCWLFDKHVTAQFIFGKVLELSWAAHTYVCLPQPLNTLWINHA